jgi:hypothetical protein
MISARIAAFALVGFLLVTGSARAQAKNAKQSAQAAKNATIHDVEAQIKTLKKERDVTVKRIRETFNQVIANKKFTDAEIETQRKFLHAQRNSLMTAAPTATEKEAIREKFNSITSWLGRAGHLDRNEIIALRQERDVNVKQVEQFYNAQTKVMQAQVDALKKAK